MGQLTAGSKFPGLNTKGDTNMICLQQKTENNPQRYNEGRDKQMAIESYNGKQVSSSDEGT